MAFLIGIFVVLLLFVAFLFFAFDTAFVRHKQIEKKVMPTLMGKPFLEYSEVINAGLKFIKSQPSERVSVTSFDGLKLSAVYIENGDSKHTIMLFHGYRSLAARDFSCAVEQYYKMGFNVLLADQRSHGESQGRLITYGVKESRDVYSWIDFIIGRCGNDCEIILGGMSMGSTTILLSAGYGLPDNVKGMIADCGFTSPYEIIRKVARQSFHISGVVVLPVLNFMCHIFGHFGIYNNSTEDALKKSDVPVLFIHGGNDNFVPNEMSRRAYKAAYIHNKQSELFIVDGADHGFSYLVDTDGVVKHIQGFLSRCLKTTG